MTVEWRDVDRRTVVAVAGEVDIATSPCLRSALEGAFDAGAHDLRLDLCDTTFMDSSALHVLLDMQRLAEAQSRRMTVVCPPGSVRRVLELTGAVKVLQVVDHA
jgi:anti-sigma B factor antagonist